MCSNIYTMTANIEIPINIQGVLFEITNFIIISVQTNVRTLIPSKGSYKARLVHEVTMTVGQIFANLFQIAY